MGGAWTVAGAALCLCCAGQSIRSDAGPAGGAGSTAATSSTGGAPPSAGAPATGGAPTRCRALDFPAPNPGRSSPAPVGLPPPPSPCEEATQFCDFGDDACGRTDPAGVCTPREACSDDDGPVCGCDGVDYPSSCAARALGVDVDSQNLCHLEGSYVCGPLPCNLNSEACVAVRSHIDGSVSARCFPIPEECRNAVASGADEFCECVRPGRCGCQSLDLAGGTAIFKLCNDR